MERLTPPTIPENEPVTPTETTDATDMVSPALDDSTRAPLESYEFSRHSKPETLAQEIVADSFRMLDIEQAKEVLRAYRKHGEAFAAYLTLEDTNVADEAIEVNFNDVYYGHQPLDTDIAEQYAHEQFWDSQYDEFMNQCDIPDDVLQLDYEKIGYILDAMFDTVELENARYLFHK